MNQVSGQFFASVMSPNRNTKLQSRLAFGECRTSNDSKVSD